MSASGGATVSGAAASDANLCGETAISTAASGVVASGVAIGDEASQHRR